MCLDVLQEVMEHRSAGPIVGRDALDLGWTELYEAYSKRLRGGS